MVKGDDENDEVCEARDWLVVESAADSIASLLVMDVELELELDEDEDEDEDGEATAVDSLGDVILTFAALKGNLVHCWPLWFTTDAMVAKCEKKRRYQSQS